MPDKIRVKLPLLLFFLFLPALSPAQDAPPPGRTSFLERFNKEIDAAALSLAAAVKAAETGGDETAGAVQIGVFPVLFSDGGTLEVGRLAKERIIAALGRAAGVEVMGELAFINAPYAVKGQLSPPLQGEMEITWLAESRTGDVDVDFKIVASASSRFRLPADPVSQSNLLLYVNRPKTSPGLPSVDIPGLEVSMRVAAERRRGRRVEKLILENGGWLAADDQFRLELEANTDCHAYVFAEDSAGDIYSIYPAPGVKAENRLEGGTRHCIPGHDDDGDPEWFFLDDKPGRERLYLIADYEPLENIDDVLSWLSGRTDDADAMAGIGGWEIRSGAAENRKYRVVDAGSMRELDSHFPVVKIFDIDHR